VPAVIGDYEICVVKSFRMNSDVLSRAKRMKLIMQFGVGLEGQIDSFSVCLLALCLLFCFVLLYLDIISLVAGFIVNQPF